MQSGNVDTFFLVCTETAVSHCLWCFTILY